MAGTIKIPGIGPVKTVYVVAGVGVTAGILGYAYWRRSHVPANAGAADAAATDTTADSSSGLVEDSTAAGYNTVYPSAYYNNPGYDPYATSDTTYSNNADWASAAESALVDAGTTLSAATLAISRVLGGLSVTSSQKELFMEAVGLIGNPPNGYPTPIKLTDNGSSPVPTGTALPAPAGFKVTSTTKTTVGLAWQKVTGAVSYHITSSSGHGHSTTSLQFREGGLKSNHTYTYHVYAVASDGTAGARTATITARTKK